MKIHQKTALVVLWFVNAVINAVCGNAPAAINALIAGYFLIVYMED